jgi:hypothetical protein
MFRFKDGPLEFENKRIYSAAHQFNMKSLNKNFTFDTRDIDWQPYLRNFMKGTCLYFMREKKSSPRHDMENALISRQEDTFVK